MNEGVWYWLILFLWAIAAGLFAGGCAPECRRQSFGSAFLMLLLLLLLGWTVFGGPVK